MDRPSRLERQLDLIEVAAKNGQFSVKLNLFPSERKKMFNMGFNVLPLGESLKTSQPCQVFWTEFHRILDANETRLIADYLRKNSVILPELFYLSDSFFLKAMRFNLSIPQQQEFFEACIDLCDSILD